MGCWLVGAEVNGTRTGSYPVMGFSINSFGPQRYLPYKPEHKANPYFSSESIIKNTKEIKAMLLENNKFFLILKPHRHL
jgi:hypothetical protein